MKKYIWAIAAGIMVASTIAFVACNKEGIDNVTTDPIVVPQTKEAYPPDPSWSRVSSAIAVLRSKSQNLWNCTNQVKGYFCGVLLEQYLVDGPAIVYVGLGEPRGLMIKNSFLTTNNLSSLIDSAENGYLTFHADIDVVSEQFQKQLGFDQIPAGRYPTTTLGDSAIYVQFSDIK